MRSEESARALSPSLHPLVVTFDGDSQRQTLGQVEYSPLLHLGTPTLTDVGLFFLSFDRV